MNNINMMKNCIIMSIVILSTTVYPQNTELSKGLGFSAGTISGSGFSYRQINNNSGFQFAFGIVSFNGSDETNYEFLEGYTGNYHSDYWTPDTNKIRTEYDYGRGTAGNFGLTYYKPLHKSDKTLFYIMVGISSYFSYDIEYSKNYKYFILTDSTYSYEPVGDVKKYTDFSNIILGGFGIGMEWRFTENIRVSAELPLTFSNIGDIFMYIPQAGIHYYYK